MDRLNHSGYLYLTHTSMQNRLTLRVCVGQTNTEIRYVERAWQRIQKVTSEIEANQASASYVYIFFVKLFGINYMTNFPDHGIME
jgi:aromatic-L-amino-acid decarboxylase